MKDSDFLGLAGRGKYPAGSIKPPLDQGRTNAHDRALLLQILGGLDPPHLVQLITTYYQDADRSDRTPKTLVIFHLGLLCGALQRVLDGTGGLA